MVVVVITVCICDLIVYWYQLWSVEAYILPFIFLSFKYNCAEYQMVLQYFFVLVTSMIYKNNDGKESVVYT